MASIKSVQFAAPKYMPVNGCAAFIQDKAVLSAAPAVGDTIDFRLPGGFEVCLLEIQADDLDTNGAPTLGFSIGYAPIQAETIYVANPTYFAPANQQIARTGGRLVVPFKPIKFEEDVMLRLTINTAAATFSAGEIFAIAGGNCHGPK